MAKGAKFSDEPVQHALRDINPQHELLKYGTEKSKERLHKGNPNPPVWRVAGHLRKDCCKPIHYQDPRTMLHGVEGLLHK